MEQTSTSPDQLITVAEAAKFLKVTRQHIYRLCESGEIKAARFGNVWRINRADLLKRVGIEEK